MGFSTSTTFYTTSNNKGNNNKLQAFLFVSMKDIFLKRMFNYLITAHKGFTV